MRQTHILQSLSSKVQFSVGRRHGYDNKVWRCETRQTVRETNRPPRLKISTVCSPIIIFRAPGSCVYLTLIFSVIQDTIYLTTCNFIHRKRIQIIECHKTLTVAGACIQGSPSICTGNNFFVLKKICKVKNKTACDVGLFSILHTRIVWIVLVYSMKTMKHEYLRPNSGQELHTNVRTRNWILRYGNGRTLS